MTNKTPHIEPEQVRAARALLDWGRAQCAKIAGLSAETIKNIEKGIFVPNASTIEKLITTFERHGVSFITFKTYHGVMLDKELLKAAISNEPETKDALPQLDDKNSLPEESE